MSDTTIRVDSDVRDKLRLLAEAEHITLGELLRRWAEREEYQREMRRANQIMEIMIDTDSGNWHGYVDELQSFELGSAADVLDDAATDWPEYNPEPGQ